MKVFDSLNTTNRTLKLKKNCKTADKKLILV